MENNDHSESIPSSFASGRQFEIRHGNTRAVITEVGAGLREFEVGGREFLDTYSQHEMASSCRGQVLLPWPNRVEHGTYEFDGKTEQLPLDEAGRPNAIHGLTRWMNWHATRHEPDNLLMSLVLHAQTGYPFVLSLQVRYALTPHGLEVETSARNIGSTSSPYGAGYHPYFTVGTDLIDTAFLEVPAQSYFLTNERLIPTPPPVSVTGTRYDFRTMRAIGDVVMDIGYTDLVPDEDGFTRVKFSAPGGNPTLIVFMDATHQFLQVFSGDTVSLLSRRRRGLAIEPYTCASNAFNNGLGLRMLQPGETFSSVWGIEV